MWLLGGRLRWALAGGSLRHLGFVIGGAGSAGLAMYTQLLYVFVPLMLVGIAAVVFSAVREGNLRARDRLSHRDID